MTDNINVGNLTDGLEGSYKYEDKEGLSEAVREIRNALSENPELAGSVDDKLHDCTNDIGVLQDFKLIGISDEDKPGLVFASSSAEGSRFLAAFVNDQNQTEFIRGSFIATDKPDSAETTADAVLNATADAAGADLTVEPKTEIWGSDKTPTEVTIFPDGKTVTTIAPGKTGWDIARDALTHRADGEKPKSSDVAKLLRAMRVVNEPNLRSGDMDNLFPGDQIVIPAAEDVASLLAQAPHGLATEINESKKEVDTAPQTDPEDSIVGDETAAVLDPEEIADAVLESQPPDAFSPFMRSHKVDPADGIYNPLAPPGLDVYPGETWGQTLERFGDNFDIKDREVKHIRPLESGNTEYKYVGHLDSSRGGDDAKFIASEEITPDGLVARREIQYKDRSRDDGVDLTLQSDQDGNTMEIAGVTKMLTTWNSSLSAYLVYIEAKGDRRYSGQVSLAGDVKHLKQVR